MYIAQEYASNITSYDDLHYIDFRIIVVSPAYSRGPMILQRVGYLVERGVRFGTER
jgi:hypothetical protein